MLRLSLLVKIAVGMPPQVEDVEPLSFTEGLMVVFVIAACFWMSVRFLTWINVKWSAWHLFAEIRRDLRRSRPGR